ncbi:hypothetical protein DIPPA_04124 [Diplonema papillatum]|nr:hypothetical protein DIPPA_04124 [Diplonema papillatum]
MASECWTFCFVPRIVLVNLYATYCGHDQLPTPADTPSDSRSTEVRVADESTPLKHNLSQSYYSGD